MKAIINRLRELRGERGSVNVEAVIGAAGLIALIGLALVGMRVMAAESAVDEAARSAARSASIATDGTAAAAAAERRAREVLSQQELSCTSLDVSVDASDFSLPLGETGYVTATVTCQVPLSDLGIPGVGGVKSATAEFRSPIDRYGARTDGAQT